MSYSPLQLANAFLKTGELNDAKQILADYLKTDDAHHSSEGQEMLRLWIDVLAHGTQAEQRLAIAEYARVIDLSPTDHIKRAMLHHHLGESATACSQLEIALAHFPEDARLCESLLFLYQRYGHWQKGLALTRTLPKTWSWSRWAGDFASMGQDWASAILHYSEALTSLSMRYAIPHDSPATWLKMPNISDADSLTIIGVYASILLSRADAYRANGNETLANADITYAKQLLPHDSTIR